MLDFYDAEPTTPEAYLEPMADADRVVAAVLPPRPGRRLAAGGPLPRHPPAAHFLGPARIGQIEDQHDVADVAVHLGRDVGVAAIDGEAVPARAAATPARDRARTDPRRDVVDTEPARWIGRRGLAAVGLAVHEHQAVGRADLVRVRAGGHLDRRQLSRLRRIADVHDRRAVRRFHVRHERHAPVDDHLSAAGAVEVADLPDSLRARAVTAHLVSPPRND